jgi:hypothetical protein
LSMSPNAAPRRTALRANATGAPAAGAGEINRRHVDEPGVRHRDALAGASRVHHVGAGHEYPSSRRCRGPRHRCPARARARERTDAGARGHVLERRPARFPGGSRSQARFTTSCRPSLVMSRAFTHARHGLGAVGERHGAQAGPRCRRPFMNRTTASCRWRRTGRASRRPPKARDATPMPFLRCARIPEAADTSAKLPSRCCAAACPAAAGSRGWSSRERRACRTAARCGSQTQ